MIALARLGPHWKDMLRCALQRFDSVIGVEFYEVSSDYFELYCEFDLDHQCETWQRELSWIAKCCSEPPQGYGPLDVNVVSDESFGTFDVSYIIQLYPDQEECNKCVPRLAKTIAKYHEEVKT